MPSKNVQPPSATWIREHTGITRPFLVPELKLWLATETSPLWRASEFDLEGWGIEEPYWAFAWPGGQALARYLLDHPQICVGKKVVDYGTGSGIVALAAAYVGAAEVLAVDIDPWSAAVVSLNAELNQLSVTPKVQDMTSRPPVHGDIVILADMSYDREMAETVKLWIQELRSNSVTVLLAEPNRGFLDTTIFERVAEYQSPSDIDVHGNYLVSTPILQAR